jgi:hypothetical protein
LSKILTAIRLSGPFWIEDRIGFYAFACPRTCCALFLRELFEIIQSRWCLSSERLNFANLASLMLTPHSRDHEAPVSRKHPEAPNFERPDREQNSRRRLTALLGMNGRTSPDSRFAMDCSVSLPRA